ncbi:hypothetical protein B0H11DRAFT_2194393 [Mycena galericulata]|nr:hypothetical protein B0H11DRAFT_2194393 [Mycena galericulata]
MTKVSEAARQGEFSYARYQGKEATPNSRLHNIHRSIVEEDFGESMVNAVDSNPTNREEGRGEGENREERRKQRSKSRKSNSGVRTETQYLRRPDTLEARRGGDEIHMHISIWSAGT